MRSPPEFKRSTDPRVGCGSKAAFEKTPINAPCVHDQIEDDTDGVRTGFTRKAYITVGKSNVKAK